jgi:sortase A
MRAVLRFVASVMIVSGTLLIADAAVTLLWQEPVSAFVAERHQGKLETAYFDPPRRVVQREPLEGDAIARIQIPAIGVSEYVIEGTDLDSLRKGPGHYPETPLPGEQGTAAIAGHRTTYGAPFHRLDELKAGDEITVTTVQGEFTYEVSETLIVSPTQVDVLEDKGDNRLTLSACHPKYSARQRIIVVSQLAEDEKPFPRPTHTEDPAPKSLDDIDGAGAPAWPAIALGVVCACIWLLAWVVGRLWRKWPSYVLAFPFFMVGLFFFFEEFSRLLPSNF